MNGPASPNPSEPGDIKDSQVPSIPPEPTAVAALPKAVAAVATPARPAVAARPRSLWERWEEQLTSMTAIGIGLAATLTLTLHALVVQLPKASMAQIVAARDEAAGLAQEIANATGYQDINQSSLSNQVALAQDFLIPKREDVVNLAVELEKLCRRFGFKPELALRTASDKAQTVEGAVIVPSTLRLHAQPVADGVASSYERLLSLLSQIESFPHKVEIVSMTAVADKDSSVSSALLELQFWIRKPNEKPAAK